MTNRAPRSPRVSNSPHPPAARAATLTRNEVAKLLRCSISTVRRLEGTELHPTVGPDGVHVFDPKELLRIAEERAARTDVPSKEGERDARVFELLDAGKGLREIVTTLRLPVELVSKLIREWQTAGRSDLVIPLACRLELQRCFGPIADATQLVAVLNKTAADGERAQEQVDRERNRVSRLLSELAIGAAKGRAVADLLPELRGLLDVEEAEMLDAMLKWVSGQSPRTT